MGSVTYDFLVDSILFNVREIDSLYSSLTESQLENLLQDYRQHCLANIVSLKNEITDKKSSLKVLSSIEEVPYKMLKQSALYFDQFIIYDPLFKFTHHENEAGRVVKKYLGFQEHGINRKDLVETIRLLKAITPMIAGDFVKILPLSYNFEPPKETPINIPINYFADVLPKEIMQYFRDRVIVKSLQQDDCGWKVLDNTDLTPGIYITFENLEGHNGQIYNFFNTEFVKTDNPNKFLSKIALAKYPMERATWDIWVFQSVNRSAKAVFDKIYIENLIASDLKATYLTDNSFTATLLTRNLSTNETVETSSASQFMNLDLPFLDSIEINKLMEIRTNEAALFTNFRIELERQFRELRTITDPKEIKLRQENIIHELGDVQVRRINQKFDSLKRKGVVDSLILIGGLLGTIQTAGWSLLASALATFYGYKNYQEYRDNLSENPSYLLWKVLKK